MDLYFSNFMFMLNQKSSNSLKLVRLYSKAIKFNNPENFDSIFKIHHPVNGFNTCSYEENSKFRSIHNLNGHPVF